MVRPEEVLHLAVMCGSAQALPLFKKPLKRAAVIWATENEENGEKKIGQLKQTKDKRWLEKSLAGKSRTKVKEATLGLNSLCFTTAESLQSKSQEDPDHVMPLCFFSSLLFFFF